MSSLNKDFDEDALLGFGEHVSSIFIPLCPLMSIIVPPK